MVFFAAVLCGGGGGGVNGDGGPSGLNPISYPLGGIVDGGSPVKITWKVCIGLTPPPRPSLLRLTGRCG